jgi:tetratricopeptide (TPR) repeat protein
MPFAIEPQTFVSVVRPLLESNDPQGLVDAIHTRWNTGQVARLLTSPDRDARKVALVCLAMVGDRCCIEAVQTQLADPDATINEMAEHALWSIWCRLGSAQSNAELCRGSKAMACRCIDQAIDHFDNAIAADPQFAEAYNQRAIARFLKEQFEESIADCRKAVRLMPGHFGALAGMGHCFLHLGQLDHALRAYERAIAINPQLHCVGQTVTEISRQLKS